MELDIIKLVGQKVFVGREDDLPSSQRDLLNGIADTKNVYTCSNHAHSLEGQPEEFVLVDVDVWNKVVALARRYLPAHEERRGNTDIYHDYDDYDHNTLVFRNYFSRKD